jgi:hypothetical protein
MGQRFFEVTMPKIADQLERLNTALQGIGNARSASHTRPAAPDATTSPPGAPAPVEAPAPAPDVMATLTQIAREHLGIATLEERKPDRLDFRDVGVLSVAAAHRAAYEAGCAAGVSETAH